MTALIATLCRKLLSRRSGPVRHAIAIFMAWLSVSSASAAELEISVGETVKIAQCHYYGFVPTVFRFSTGELGLFYKMDDDRHDVEGTLLGFHRSQDGGKSWGIRRTLGMIYRELSYWTRPDGSVLLLGGYGLPGDLKPLDAAGEEWGGQDFEHLRFASVELTDGGRSFKFRRDVQMHLPKPAMGQRVEDDVFNFARLGRGKISYLPFVVFHGPVIETRDGGLLAAVYGKFVSDLKIRAFVVRSDGDPKNWKYLSTIADDRHADLIPGEAKSLRDNNMRAGSVPSMQGFPEPYMIRLRDGRLFVVMRRGHNNFMFKSWSEDEGNTWTEPESIGFRGVNPGLCQLDNGILVLITGRPDPVSLYFSTDHGQTWSDPTVIYEGRSSLNCHLVQVAPERVLVVYDHLPVDWGIIPESQPRRKGGGPDWQPSAMNQILGTFVDARRER